MSQIETFLALAGSQDANRRSASSGPPVSSHQSLKVAWSKSSLLGSGSSPTTLSEPNARISTLVQRPRPAPMSMTRPQGHQMKRQMSSTASAQGNDQPRFGTSSALCRTTRAGQGPTASSRLTCNELFHRRATERSQRPSGEGYCGGSRIVSPGG